MKEPFWKCILFVVLSNVHLELQNNPVISCLLAGKNYCCHRGGGLPPLTISTHCLYIRRGSKTKDETKLYIVTNGLQTACTLE